MSKLTEAAGLALLERMRADKERRLRDRDASFERVKERWPDKIYGFGRLAKDGYDAGPMPARDEFEFVPYPGYRILDSYRGEHVHGWKIEVDDVPFLFSVASGSSSLYLILSCPQCGVEGASTFYNLEDIGSLLTKGPKFGHTCRERESRDVAHAIATAARDLKMRPDEVVELAYELHSDLIIRLMAR
jgi:hypothetical protein